VFGANRRIEIGRNGARDVGGIEDGDGKGDVLFCAARAFPTTPATASGLTKLVMARPNGGAAMAVLGI
jgi:hypothetical protein